ncbi:MAG: methyltransferase regulatory domain-containing protein [Planctomycetota bacterium]
MASTQSASGEGYLTDVAYIPGFYPNMAPLVLRYVAALNRVVPPPATGYRYLELGCGLGRSLTTLAAANPGSEFVGVDINPEHTAAVEKDVAAGGLANVRVITGGFGSLPDDIGSFEFITLHGILSWVSPRVRDEILAVARSRLAPGGLLLVSYNAMPGWAHLQPIRGILKQYAALRQGDSLQRVRDALAYLVFIRDRQARYFETNPQASAYVDGLLKQDIRYLAHEYLNDDWTSFYFAEVAGMFRGAGLGFVGSLPVFTNFWDLCVRPEFQELFRTTTDRLVTEAHKDFCANTAFRWDVYGKASVAMPDVESRLQHCDDIHYRVARRGLTLPYQVNLGVVTSTVQGPLYQALLGLLGDQSLRLSEILAADALRGTPPADLVRAVDAGVAMGMFDIAAVPVPGVATAPAAPRLTTAFNEAVLAADSLGGRPLALASTVTGTGHTIGDFDAAILHELVARGRAGLAERVDTRLAGSGRMLQKDGQPVSDPAARRQLVDQACAAFLEQTLPTLAQIGIVSEA